METDIFYNNDTLQLLIVILVKCKKERKYSNISKIQEIRLENDVENLLWKFH